MESSTTIKNLNGNLSRQLISTSIEPSLPYISFPQKITNNTSDVSFSSYIRPQDHQVEDSEISIFEAHNYFNESNDVAAAKVGKRVSPVKMMIDLQHTDLSGLSRFSSASLADGFSRNYRVRSFHATPTASSEASWNSQTGLLSNPPGAIAVSIRNPASATDHKKKKGSAAKWLVFGPKCPCSGKKSVQVVEKREEPRTPTLNPTKSVILEEVKNHRISAELENHRFPPTTRPTILPPSRIRPFSDIGTATTGFTFPILNQSPDPMRLVPLIDHHVEEDPPRDSLEVFRPLDHEQPAAAGTRKSRRQTSLTFLTSPRSRDDDEVASDASSDLFEIESFSTQTTTNASYPILYNNNNNRPDSMDEASSFDASRRLGGAGSGSLYCRRSLDEPILMMAESTYEPSEASIDWSVTTAEAISVTNFSVTASELAVDDNMAIINISNKSDGGGGGKRRSGNGLLSCRCEKAVSVGPRPLKCVPEREKEREGQRELRHVSSRPPNVDKPPLARSRSARLSLPFTT